MASFKTEQEQFWAGEFGKEYANRNQGGDLVASNLAFFTKVLNRCGSIDSVIEFGSNIGLNLVALQRLLPKAKLSAIEINPESVEILKQNVDGVTVFPQSILNFEPGSQWDFVLSKGVLIHINPDELPSVYDLMHRSSKRLICVAEYYNPQPVEIPYRGHSGKLFKRDFAGELMDRFPDLSLVDYGFAYHRGPFPQDDLTWFLLEKR
ncbi:MAG: pseudaminic acid biosynthesis-associated methylase [Candidatus Nitronauta litoralis]|uniref:Pseudaminic acid biosynthesis-associated methylase n=1 Tax=Candidatus Nitronauta litoralis TaxID=2705533 RepID=A0A7T0G035_9BACT|nr:MAG: pseudaminic acid biosynthesis-associated methylase [Candidatus Nitronauta litoralis]